MAGIKIKSGHAVTGSIPPNSDAAQVSPANVQFPAGPQEGMAPSAGKKKGFPPAN